MTDQTPTRPKSPIPGCLFFVIVLAFMIWGVASCGGSDATKSSGTKPSPVAQAPAAAQGGTDTRTVREVAYVATLKSSSGDYSAYGNPDLIRLGRNVCTALEEGNSATAVGLALVGSTSLDMASAGFLEGAAIGAFCPDHSDDVTS